MMSARQSDRDGSPDRFKSLYLLLAALSRATALEEVYAASITSLLEATSANRAAILLFDDDGVMRFKASRGLSRKYQTAVEGHSPWQRGAQDSKVIVVTDMLAEDSLSAYHPIMRQEGVRGAAFLPLELDAGVIGKLMLYFDSPHTCTQEEMELATAMA